MSARSVMRAQPVQRVLNQLRGEGLRARSVRSSSWTLLGFGMQQILRLGSNLILTRLLFPEAFGHMSLAAVYMTGLEMFSDIGIRPSIIQSKRGDDPDFLNTAWTMQIIRGFVLCIIACILAYPISQFYNADILFPLLSLVGLTAIIRGFQTTGYATMNRKLQLGLLTQIELVSRLLGILTMVLWAFISPTVWALAAGGAVNSLSLVILAHVLINTHRHRLLWDRECVKELIGFGKWIFITSILTFIAQSGDRFLLPALFDFKDLGYYSLAIGLVMVPIQIMKRLSSKVLFPAYAELHNREDPRKLNAMITRFAKISFPVYVFPLSLIVLGPYIISLMYDARYQNAGTMTSILAVGGFFAIMRASQAGILLAVGKSKLAMYIQLGKTLTYIIGGILLAKEWGLDGYCAGLAVSEAVSYCIQRVMVSKALGRQAVRLDRVLLIVLLSVVVLTAWFYGRW